MKNCIISKINCFFFQELKSWNQESAESTSDGNSDGVEVRSCTENFKPIVAAIMLIAGSEGIYGNKDRQNNGRIIQSDDSTVSRQ